MQERSKARRLADLVPYREAGLQLIVLRKWDARGKPTPDHPDGLPVGKAPRDAMWRRLTYSDRQVNEAVAKGFNVGYRMGPLEAVIDYDPRHDPDGSGRTALLASVPPGFLDSCPHVRTGSGGDHWYVRLAAQVPLRANVEGMPGVELKGHGRQVVAAGSKHPDGPYYDFDDLSPHPARAPLLSPDSVLLRAATRPGGGDHSDVGVGEWDGDQLARVLAHLDPTDFRDHDSWLQVGMASWHATGGAGEDAFVEWSTQDPEFADHEAVIRERWTSFRRTEGNVVTLRTLFKHVEAAGGSLNGLYADEFPDDAEQVAAAIAEPAEPPKPVGMAGWGDDPIVEGPNAALYALNRRFCVVPEGGKTVVYERLSQKLMRPGDFPMRRHSTEGFSSLLRNRYIERPGENGKSKMVKVAGAWLDWPKRREAPGGVTFAPGGAPPEFLNTWTGWGVTPDASKSWPRIEELVRDVLVCGDSASAEYLLSWCAFMVQHPEQQAEVAVVFRGARGTGKGSFLGPHGVLGTIAGRHGQQVTSGITRKFNMILRDCVYLFADEAFWAGDKAGEGTLKGMITEPTLLIEPKGLEAYSSPNRLHVAIASNEDWVIPAGHDERRFAVFEVSDARQGDHAFWTALRAEMAAGGVQGFMAAMLARDIAGWHPRLDVPSTGALERQKIESLDPVATWWYSVLKGGRMDYAVTEPDGSHPSWLTDPVTARTEDIQTAFRSTVARHVPLRGMQTQLGMRLRRMCPGIMVRRNDADRAYVFPPLPQARREFEEYVRSGPTIWED